MAKREWFGAAALMTFALAGCASSLEVRRYAPEQEMTGYPHRLKMSQYDVTVNWRIVDCDKTKSPPLRFKIGAEVKEKTEFDADQFFVVNPTSSQGVFQTSEVAMEWYEDRGTKSVNSTVDDQTGPAIVSVVSTIAKVAGAIVMVSEPPPTPSTGSAEVSTALTNAARQEAIVKQLQVAVDEQKLLVSRLTAKIALAGAAASPQDRADLGQAETVLTALVAQLDGEQAKLKQILSVLTDSKTTTWPLTSAEFASTDPVLPSASKVLPWGEDRSRLGVYFRLVPITPLPAGKTLPVAIAAEPKGLPYREPAPMTLQICSADPCEADPPPDRVLMQETRVLVLQGGSPFYLPFHSRRFATIKNAAAFSQSGVLISAGSSQTKAPGAAVVATAKDVGDQLVAYSEVQRGAEAKKLAARTEELKARKALEDAKAALQPVADADKAKLIAAYQTDATLAQAERAKLEAEEALAKARQLLGQ